MNRYLKYFLYISFFCGLLGFAGGIGSLLYINNNLPEIDSLNVYEPSVPSYITSREGEVLAKLSVEDRQVIAIEQMPDIVINSFLAAEDDNFWEHSGVDFLGVLRALIANIKAGRVVQGGSTITQQVAKSFLLTSERSIIRKIKDFLLAIKIEKKFSKKEILHLYLNQVYLGGGYYGVKSAFSGYFGKDLTEVSVAEAAMVAGLLVAPGRYSPYINPEYAKRRQRYVLGRLLATGKIDQDKYEEAQAEKIKYRLRESSPFQAGYFTDWVRQRVTELVGKEEFLTGGYRIKTTIDWKLQQSAEKEVLNGVLNIDKRQGFGGAKKSYPIFDKNIFPSEKYKEIVGKKRHASYRDRSTFFTINENFEKEFEVKISEDEINKIYAYQKQYDDLSSLRYFHAGYNPEDPYLEYIEVDKTYNATVIEPFDRGGIILIEIGGIRGLVSEDNFKWAHERSISEKPQWYGPVDRPSRLVKKGDVIKVKVLDKKTTLSKSYTKNYMGLVKKTSSFKKHAETFGSQLFLDCALEQEPEVQAALVSLSPSNGEILSFVGGSDFSKSQFNRVIQSLRQPGSSFKPIIYAAGLENGFKPNSIIIDSPEALASNDVGVNWKPRNYDGKFKGPMTLRGALEISRNIPTIKLAQEVGVQKIHEFAKRIGFKAEMDKDLSLSLGSFGATLLDMVRTYAVFPSGGQFIEPKSILEIRDREGKLIEFVERDGEIKFKTEEPEEEKEIAKEAKPNTSPVKEVTAKKEGEEGGSDPESEEPEVNPFHENLSKNQVYDERLAYIMTNLLKGVVINGSGRRAINLAPFVGGKTGTTSNYVDAWFIGFASNIVTGVWTGFDQNETMGFGEAGSSAALPIWKGYMEYALDYLGKVDFQVPPGIVNVYINKQTGEMSEGANYLESFVEGFEPGTEKEVEKIDEDSQLNIIEEDDFYDSL